MVVTDLDGTLIDRSGKLSARNREALELLGARGRIRVVATGRSLYSARRVIDRDFPIDYLAFASGAGICAWPSQELLVTHQMSRAETELAAGCLRRRGLDHMLHLELPESHRFLFWSGGGTNPDFERRLDRYREFAAPCPPVLHAELSATQFVAIEPEGCASQYDAIVADLPGLNVVRTTSPLDHASRWIEVFSRAASKSRAAAWLCERTRIAAAAVVAVGNDFNDHDLLEWAGLPHVVANAPEDLRARYPVVAAHDRNGFADAVQALLEGARG